MPTTPTANIGLGKPARGDASWEAVLNTNFDIIDTLFSTATFTSGSIPFFGPAGSLSQDNANLFWNDANVALGIGTNTTSATWRVDIANSTFATLRLTSSAYNILRFHDNSAAANSKIWDVFTNAGVLNFRISNDAENTTNNWLTVTRSGATVSAVTVTTGGLVCGAPSGGSKGTGTISAVAVWRNGSALDKVFEPDYGLVPLTDLRAYYEEHKTLPTIPRSVVEGESVEMGKLTDSLWETVECQARYIVSLHERLAALEERV